jgi:hypothetical protein
MDAYKQAQDMTAKEYADQQEIYAPMATQFKSIFDLGPSQEGMSPAEKANLETQVVEGTTQNYTQAAQAVNRQIASQGGVGLPSGAADQLKLDTATSAAQEKTREETGIVSSDYSLGREDWQNAASGLETIAAGENPLGYVNATTSSGSAAASTANQIASQQNSWINAALGVAGAVVEQNPHNVFG